MSTPVINVKQEISRLIKRLNWLLQDPDCTEEFRNKALKALQELTK